MKQGAINSAQKFQPRQIVCLEHGHTCLYADMVEFVESRQMCWVRPLMLAEKADDNSLQSLCDLRLGADLLWPASLFRPALDTEVIPLLVQLSVLETQTLSSSEAHRQLASFVRLVWQASKSAF